MRSSFRAYLALASTLSLGVLASSVSSCGDSSSGATAEDGGSNDGSGSDGTASGDGSPDVDANVPVGALDVAPTFTFESGPVRPIAMSPDGTHLFVANTAHASLDVFTITASGLIPAGSVFVGIDPVAVAARTNTEAWVVNQVSDSISIVDTSTNPPHVVRTLLVGDEPSDIVFGGAANARAFVTTAHRGQQRTDSSIAAVPGAGDPQLTTPSIGRADVWVFDSTNLGTTVGGTPVSIVSLFGDTPRALAVTPDGNTVYAAIFKSGNQSTVTSSELPCPGFSTSTPCTVSGASVPGSPIGPSTNYAGITSPAVSVLLKMDSTGTLWKDQIGRDWTANTMFTLPDEDVFAIDATTLTTKATYLHVGTTLFAMAVNPASGKLYVSNTESRNDLRDEGPGTYLPGVTLQGHIAESRVTVINGGSSPSITPRYLNKHIDYATRPAPAGISDHSLATPTNIAVTADGSTMYVSAFGSSKIGVLPTATLENDTFNPLTDSANYISVTGGGPSGIVLDEANHRAFVATRFDDGVSIVDLTSKTETAHLKLTTNEPTKVTAGRRFLYDATVSSSNGEAACASCHMFGDDDHLSWDLSNPDGDVTDNPITVKLKQGAPAGINGTGNASQLHPNKGPMSTQTLRGTVNHGPMHWRGDRVAGFFGADTRTAPPYDSELAFKNFIVAFNSLLGLGPTFSSTDMQTFADFALAITMPPNPIRALDNSLNATQAAGRSFYMGCTGVDSLTGNPVNCTNDIPATGTAHFADGVTTPGFGFACNGCHVLDPANGYFGTDGESSFENLPQTMKVPQLRNLYDKVGMFGNTAIPNVNVENNTPQGAQIRGFGFSHDGSIDTIFRFLQAVVFNDQGGQVGFANDDARRAVEQYILAFDSDLAPIVGQQVTLRSDNAAAAGPRIDLFVARATAPFASKILGASAHECDLVARAIVGGKAVAYRLQADKSWASANGTTTLSDAALRALASTVGQEVTYTCMPPGWLN
jgi:YVTN family beta-propeller protein